MNQIPPHPSLEGRRNKCWVRNNAEDLIYKSRKDNLSCGRKDLPHAQGNWRPTGPRLHWGCRSAYTGAASIYTLCFLSQKLVLSHHFVNSAWPVAKGLLRSQYSYGQDGAPWHFQHEKQQGWNMLNLLVHPVTLDRSQILPSEAGQLEKSIRQALRTPGTLRSPWRQGFQHSWSLQPISHMCT